MVDLLFLTLDRFELTRRCFDSLEATLISRADVICRILDNGSEDSRVPRYLSELAKRHPSRVLLELSNHNKGVAGGREWLWQRANGEFAIFLDSDVIFPKTDTWLVKLLDAMQDPRVGVAGQEGSWIKPDWSWFNNSGRDYVGTCDVVCGYCHIARVKLREEGVHFDQAFNPYWHEDADFCLQARSKGYQVKCIGAIGIEHTWGKQGATAQDGKRKMAYLASKWR